MPDALQMLRDDHKKVKDIFKQFEDTDDAKQKQQLVKAALHELEVHTRLEEEIFYPAVREEADVEEEQMEEAEEEHHVADMLMAELKTYKSNPKMDAKFTVLAESVKHHIEEEESEMLPKAAELGMQRMNELGEEMREFKMELEQGMKGGRRSTSRNGSSGRSRSRSGAMSRSSAGRTTRKSTSGTSRKSATKSSGSRSRSSSSASKSTRSRPTSSRSSTSSRSRTASPRSRASSKSSSRSRR
jgi:hypothetical protein